MKVGKETKTEYVRGYFFVSAQVEKGADITAVVGTLAQDGASESMSLDAFLANMKKVAGVGFDIRITAEFIPKDV